MSESTVGGGPPGTIGEAGSQAGGGAAAGVRVSEFLPQLSLAQMEKIKAELHGMIGQRIELSTDNIIQVRRAVNLLLQDIGKVLTDAVQDARVVAVLFSEPSVASLAMSSLRQGGATHLAINVPKIFQPALDTYQATGMESALKQLLKIKGFKHPIGLLAGAASLGIKLVAVGDEVIDQPERRSSTIESIALDISNILDSQRDARVILWAGSQYVHRSRDRKICQSSVDYLALNYRVFNIHNGSYLVDGGPLRKLVFDLQLPGAIITGKSRIIDNLATGIEGDTYGDWNAVLLHPRPALDFSYFITND